MESIDSSCSRPRFFLLACILVSLVIPACTGEDPFDPSAETIELGERDCTAECVEGFTLNGTEYLNGCDQLDDARHPVDPDVLISGDVSWSDKTIEIRLIDGVPDASYLAVLHAPTVCGGEPGPDQWYLATSTRTGDDLDRYCDLTIQGC